MNMNTTTKKDKMTDYYIMFQIEKQGSDILFDRSECVKAQSPQQAVDLLYNQFDNIYTVESVSTYHEDHLGRYFKERDWA